MKINIRENIYNLNLDDLVSIGYRDNNSKRNFLFISKILGKHIEVRPNICRITGFLLVSTILGTTKGTSILINYIENHEDNNIKVNEVMKLAYRTNEKLVVIGFAETATGIGMAVASAIENSYYVTTTRENIEGIKSFLNFEEEHSHATTHKCFPEDIYKLREADRIILVDDEITTGKSMLNIIKELKRNTGVRKYEILTILDWRNIDQRNSYKDFIRKNKVEIEVKALISGEIKVEDNNVYCYKKENILSETMKVNYLNILSRKGKYLKFTGRFGVDFEDIKKTEEECIKAANKIQEIIGDNKKILVLGHGENIYIPSRIASYLKGEVYFKSTTRSPIYCSDEISYLINERSSFYHNGFKYYFYNKSRIEKDYEKVILITEDDLNIKLTNNLIIVKP
ncbi:phosphoribosyltransferase domain-containing protein [Clostridium nigeriense]|uniref:phosphoribosyltransferase domain-containing protein n=1 Tax=Clostridium nigeriense TaxID=1805470 RepID=UPI003D32666A